MRQFGTAIGLAACAALAGTSAYTLLGGTEMARSDMSAVHAPVVFEPCAGEPAETEILAARQAIRAFLADRHIEGRFRTAATIGAATWTGRYLADLRAYRIDVAVHDHVAPGHPHHRHYAYLVNATGCTVPDTVDQNPGV